MLTKKQQEIRLTGVGASEVSALVGMHPYRGALDVWLEKPTPSRGPLLVPDQDVDGESNAAVGEEIEAGLIALYTRRTKIEVRRPQRTYRHRRFPHVLASPDGLARTEDLGVEIKVVGQRMQHHWEGESIPDYVLTQVVQNMAVMGRERWDVCALIGGTDFRVYSVYRDRELERDLANAVEGFWSDFIEADVQPEPSNTEELRRYLKARYPGSTATKCLSDNRPEIATAASRLAEVAMALKSLEAEKSALEAQLCEVVGDGYGIEGQWGKFLWFPCRGRVDWKAVAEELAGGAVSTEAIERHRGNPYRVAKLCEPKSKETR